MSYFTDGFEKRAEGEGSTPSWRKALPGIAAGVGALGAGAATYGLLRKGGKRLISVTPYSRNKNIVADLKKGIVREPATRIGKKFHQLVLGADEVHPVRITGKNAVYTKRKFDTDKEVVFTSLRVNPKKYVEGKVPEVYGSRGGSFSARGEDAMRSDKLRESAFINRVAPELHASTSGMRKSHTKNKVSLGKFHESFSKRHGDYILKHRASVQSGPGGESFLSSHDMSTHLSGGKLDPSKQAVLEHVIKNPTQYVAQKKHDLVRSSVTGKPVEYRVHTVGDKVLDVHARTPHFGFDKSKAEATAQEFINKMPEDMRKKKTMFAMDVAKTKDGYKIIETNPGGGSGFLSPMFMKKKGLTGMPGFFSAVSSRQKLYKQLTGRSSQLEAGVKGIGAAGVSGTAAYAGTKKALEPSSQTSQQT